MTFGGGGRVVGRRERREGRLRGWLVAWDNAGLSSHEFTISIALAPFQLPHTRTHTCMYSALTHTHTHTQTRTHTHAHAHTRTHTLTHAPT